MQDTKAHRVYPVDIGLRNEHLVMGKARDVGILNRGKLHSHSDRTKLSSINIDFGNQERVNHLTEVIKEALLA